MDKIVLLKIADERKNSNFYLKYKKIKICVYTYTKILVIHEPVTHDIEYLTRGQNVAHARHRDQLH